MIHHNNESMQHKGLWISFKQVTPDIPLVEGVISPDLCEACDAPAGSFKNFTPEITLFSMGEHQATMVTSLKPEWYKKEQLGLDVYHVSETAMLHLEEGAGGALVVNAMVVNAGIENETDGGASEDPRQKWRHCGTGFIDIKTLLKHVWTQTPVCINIKHAAIEQCAPEVLVRFIVNSNIDEHMLPGLMSSGFFCNKFLESLEELQLKLPESADDPVNSFTKWYVDTQTKLGETCSTWVRDVTKFEEQIEADQSNGISTTLSDEQQHNGVKKFMCEMLSPCMDKMVMGTPFMKDYLKPRDTNNHVKGGYYTALSIKTSGVSEQSMQLGIENMIHEMICCSCDGEVTDAQHEKQLSMLSEHHGFSKINLDTVDIPKTFSVDMDNHEHSQAIKMAELVNLAEKQIRNEFVQIERTFVTTPTSNPNMTRYSFDQAVMGEIVDDGKQDKSLMSLEMSEDGTIQIHKNVQQKYMSSITENMATATSIASKVIDDGNGSVKFFHDGAIDDCETQGLTCAAMMDMKKQFIKDLQFDSMLKKAKSEKMSYDRLKTHLETIVQMHMHDDKQWGKWKLLHLPLTSKRLMLYLVLTSHFVWGNNMINIDLGLVASGSGDVESARATQAKFPEHQFGGKMKRFRFKADDLDNLKQIAGVGGHCIGVLRSYWPCSHLVQYADRQASKKVMAFSNHQRKGHRTTHVIEGTSSAWGIQPGWVDFTQRNVEGTGDVSGIYEEIKKKGAEVLEAAKKKYTEVRGDPEKNPTPEVPAPEVPAPEVPAPETKAAPKDTEHPMTMNDSIVRVTAPCLIAQRHLAKKLQFTKGTRMKLLLPVDASVEHSENNPFPGFYRSIVILGGNIALNSNGVPGVDISTMCQHGIYPDSSTHTNPNYQASYPEQQKLPRNNYEVDHGVRMLSSFNDFKHDSITDTPVREQTYSASTTGTPPLQKLTAPVPLIIPIVDRTDPTVCKILEHIDIFKKTMDFPSFSKTVMEHNLAQFHPIDSIFPEYVDCDVSYARCVSSFVYIPASETDMEHMLGEVSSFNKAHDGIKLSQPFLVGANNGENDCICVAVTMKSHVTPVSKM
jgi:hypothetical protein